MKNHIVNLANQHDIKYVRTSLSEMAKIITELSDDKVVQDDVERLVIALRKAEVISSEEMLLLLHGYLKELADV